MKIQPTGPPKAEPTPHPGEPSVIRREVPASFAAATQEPAEILGGGPALPGWDSELEQMQREWDAQFSDLKLDASLRDARDSFWRDFWFVTKGASKALGCLAVMFVLGMLIMRVGLLTAFYAAGCLWIGWLLFILVKRQLAPWDDV